MAKAGEAVGVSATAGVDRPRLQRRVVRGLAGAQVLGGVGMASGLAVGALLARELSGSDTLSGIGTTTQVLGSALIAVPVARLMAARGRRPGLQLGLVLAFVGAALVIASAVWRSFPLMLVGMFLFGGGTTANNQARYAAADLAAPQHRGRDLSVVVWATTIGSVLGPNLLGPGKAVAAALGLPPLVGSFTFSMAGFVLAFLVVGAVLRPDPLVVARALHAAEATEEQDHDGSMSRGLRVMRVNPGARLGMLTTALGHVVMVSVMVMTPLHMRHGDATLEIIGFVISVHILGMYVLSPVVGWSVDRWGPRPVALTGGVILATSGVLASLTDVGWSGILLVALFLLGVGWSCTLVSGSSLLVSSVRPDERPATQGLSDVVMGLAGAGGGAVAGFIVAGPGYGTLALSATAVSVVVIALHLRPRATRPA